MPVRHIALTTLTLVAILLGATLSVCAPAQQATTKKAPPSFSGKDHKVIAATKSPITVSDQDVADAVLGSALEQMYNQGDEFFHLGEWNHCINMFKIVELGDPHNVETYCGTAFLLWSSDRNDQAIEQLKLGLQNNPDSYYMYDELGTHYWIRLKDAVSAIPYYQKAITFKCPWSTFHNLAFCYQKLNRWQEAVDTWRASTKFGDDRVAPLRLKQAEAHLSAGGDHK